MSATTMRPLRTVRCAAAALLVLTTAALATDAATPVRVVDFSPRGTARQVRQAVARFSAPVVRLGDPGGGPAPFDVECAVPGAPRWTDSRTWVWDFVRDLPAGLRCTARLRPDLRTADGRPVTGDPTYVFTTGGPAIRSSVPVAGDEGIDEEQAFVLTLDGPVTEPSLLAHAAFRIDGLPDPVGVTVLGGAARDEILRSLSLPETTDPVVVLRARQRFPSATRVTLAWGAGIASPDGVATEAPQLLAFRTRPPFTARVACQRVNRTADCNPLMPIVVHFAAPVPWTRAREAVLRGPGDARWSPLAPENPEAPVARIEFAPPFPDSARLTLDLPDPLADEAGRPLANRGDTPFTVRTDRLPPLAKFAARFAIVEAADPTLPVTLRNVESLVAAAQARLTTEQPAGLRVSLDRLLARVRGEVRRIPAERLEDILPWLRRVGRARRDRSVFAPPAPPAQSRSAVELAKPGAPAVTEVVGIPLPGPGLYVVELASPRLGAALLGRNDTMYVPAVALVTKLAVHLKWGRETSLVWVTTLDRARTVAGARVSILDCTGTVRWSGTTDRDGLARIAGLPPPDGAPQCPEPAPPAGGAAADDGGDADPAWWSLPDALDGLDGGLLVVAQTPDDLGLAHSGWQRGIEPWRFDVPPDTASGPLVAHTVFDRTLLRAGETVHMKHVLRRAGDRGFSLVPAGERPTRLLIRHEGSADRHELPLDWAANGTAESVWPIPPTARLGRYAVVLAGPEDAGADGQPAGAELPSGSFSVEEFRVPLMRATLGLPAPPPVAATSVPVDISVVYLAGGPAARLPVVLRTQLRPHAVKAPPGMESLAFATGPVTVGRRRAGETGADEAAAGALRPGPVRRQEVVLDDTGSARAIVGGLPPSPAAREILVEAEYRDPNGERQTVASVLPLWPARWLVGIGADGWTHSRGTVRARVAVIDAAGQPVAGAPVRVVAHPRRTHTTRKRLVGGFYAYDTVEETGPAAGTLCSGRTGPNGLFPCEGTAPAEGNLVLEATVTDPDGRTSATTADVWVAGTGDWWFDPGNADRIDILPERLQYAPGETARLQVRMPFRAATALVTTERAGVLDARVVPLRGTEPVVTVPVRDVHAPNVFVSVLAVRGRVAGVRPTALVDLGRPAWRLGIAELRVGWQAQALEVRVTTDRPVYRVRETATATVTVRPAAGTPLPSGGELAVAAVDEGLLEVQPNGSWDLLAAMMGRRGHGVQTATAQMEVVGKRHYGRKALPAGGGGGRQGARELFDTLLLWRGRVPLDATGTASVAVPLNDSLTSFRIVAVATAGPGLFGTGSTTIRSSQDLMVLSGLPPVVREGDRFGAAFTVRNTTGQELGVVVAGDVEGLAGALEPRKLRLPAGEARIVEWEVTVPAGVAALTYDIRASVPGGPSDRLRVRQDVRPAVPVRTLQATLARWTADTPPLAVERPAGALPDRGGPAVEVAPSLAAGLGGVRDYMRNYPYTCLEQRVSRAVVLREPAVWEEVAAALPSHLDEQGFLKYFSGQGSGSDVLTAYVLAVTAAAGLPLPAGVPERLTAALSGFVRGTLSRPSAVPAADLPLRKLAAIAALARAGAADPAMLDTVAREPDLWPTSALLDWWDILARLPQLPGRDRELETAARILRARLDVRGTTIALSAGQAPSLWWLMVCPDTSAVRLLDVALDAPGWAADVPLLLRGALARLRDGHWDCTTSNAWGSIAVRRFAERHDTAPVSGTVRVALGSETREQRWPDPPVPLRFDFAWPPVAAPLAVRPQGTGSPWVTVSVRAALPLAAPVASGYRVVRTVTPLEQRTPGRWSQGDILRVRLEVEAQRDMTWVVVTDPLPAGASYVAAGDPPAASREDGWTPVPAFVERAFDAYRAYFDFVPKGSFAAGYALRLNQSGTFHLPATRVEALYEPDLYGETPNAVLTVEP